MDERALSLEQQIPKPIESFNEIGYSGTGGRPDINGHISRLMAIDY